MATVLPGITTSTTGHPNHEAWVDSCRHRQAPSLPSALAAAAGAWARASMGSMGSMGEVWEGLAAKHEDLAAHDMGGSHAALSLGARWIPAQGGRRSRTWTLPVKQSPRCIFQPADKGSEMVSRAWWPPHPPTASKKASAS